MYKRQYEEGGYNRHGFKNEINNLKDMVVSINSGVDVDISDVDDDADKKSFSFTEGGVEDEIIESPEEGSEAL